MPRNLVLDTVLEAMNPAQWSRGGVCGCQPPLRDVPHSHDVGVNALLRLFRGEVVYWQQGNNLREGAITLGKTMARLVPRP